ncbi:MAG: Citrate transporter [Acetothermia bacterium 64_32]|nr:MAG: Citrate transporter [Acetothermia bacterium 64_32]HAF69808.1 citrate transporter [Candidatus Acetothermia bacterium]
MNWGSAMASTGIFLVTYGLIFSQRVHRTIAALAGAIAMIAVGVGLGFYDWETAVRAVDFGTIGLLLGMMIVVGILQKTGFFQYMAIVAAQWTRGNPWLLLFSLAGFTALVSTVLDNVTTIVMVAPVTVSLAEVVGISAVPFLIAEAVCSNVGGVATLVGDPPNILIGSAAGLSFNDFLTHLGPVVLVTLVFSFGLLWLLFRRELSAPPERVESLMAIDARRALLDPKTMRRMLAVVGLTVVLYLIHDLLHLPPGLVALIGASLGLLWVRPQVDEILSKIHWDVLLFFIGLFIVVGGLEAAGVLAWVSTHLGFLAHSGMLLAALAILWVGALMSAVVDNIPFTIAMLPVIKGLGAQGVATGPLWWALALGVGFGGNATPVGATANVVVISLSERTDRPITIRHWMRSGTWLALLGCGVGSLAIWLGVEFGWFS